MERYIDTNGRGISWERVDPDVIGFRDELMRKFPKLRVTSAKRSWGAGRHQKGEAMDLSADPDIQKFLYSDEGNNLLLKYNLGFLDESLENNLKATGGTGPHFHIGKDSTLRGNKYVGGNASMGNTAVVATTNTEPSNSKPDFNTPNIDKAYENSLDYGDPQFLSKILQQRMQQEQELSQQYEEEKASAARQNAIQERLKERMENQVQLASMIQGNNVSVIGRDRNQSMADGGEVQGLDSNLQYKIDMLKLMIPNFKTVNPEKSNTYKELSRVRSDINNLYGAIASAKPRETMVMPTSTNQPTEETGSSNSAPSAPTTTAEKLLIKLRGLGLQDTQVFGILGSLSGESGINLSSTALNPTSKAFGIAQWLGGRLSDLKEFGKKQGRDFKNEDIQIDYLIHELQNTSERKALYAVKKAKTIEEAANIWTRVFERPSERELQLSMGARVKNAKMFQKNLSQ